MTNLPHPPGYKNTGKGCFRRLSFEEQKIVANYAKEHGSCKAQVRFSISDGVVSRSLRAVGIKPWPAHRPKSYTDADVADWGKHMKKLVKLGHTTRRAVGDTAKFFAVDPSTVKRRLHIRNLP